MGNEHDREGRSITLLVFNCLLFGFFTIDRIRSNGSTHYSYRLFSLIFEFLVLVVLPTACFAVARRKMAKPDRRLLLMQCLSGFFPWMAFGIIFLLRLAICLRTWNKIGKLPAAEDVS